jgi:hypothetical protein
MACVLNRVGLGFAFELMIKAAKGVGCHPVTALALIDRAFLSKMIHDLAMG